MAPLYQCERVQVGDEFVAPAADWKSLEAGSHFELMTWIVRKFSCGYNTPRDRGHEIGDARCGGKGNQIWRACLIKVLPILPL